MEARVENLPAILSFALECAEKLSWTEIRLADIELVIEEAVVNVCKYAYPDGDGLLEVSCQGDENSLHIRITDTGKPFDLLSAAEPDLNADILEREIGGLGCFLIRTLADTVTYHRDGEKNILELTFLPGKKNGGRADCG
jgi:anti-sigma regulatory factor (Ser/Thr protein kinase)